MKKIKTKIRNTKKSKKVKIKTKIRNTKKK
jgi:hypothetical protein